MRYINWKGPHGLETVDEFETAKEARAMVAEYNLAFGGGCYVSRRACKGWK